MQTYYPSPAEKIIIDTVAEKLNVSPDIHPKDFIFQFAYNSRKFSSKEKAIQFYFTDGQNSGRKLLFLLKEILEYDSSKTIELLEFASGYGKLTRHIKNVIPFAEVTSCDIHLDALQFITNSLNVNSILSHSNPEEFHLEKKYDVVFALSFFSHMPKTTFGKWIKQLSSFVKPDGNLIFTTHGFVSANKALSSVCLDNDGFWFKPDSEQKDLKKEEYGVTCSLPKYVFSKIMENNKRLIFFSEAFWWKHQDCYIVRGYESF